mmetsp:Transcript_23196/g.40815  ORF Transcript_23196/g.40815 Transcript_23196/m.40815 type:complete len:697 (+) Transcript_23196:76-2166(+)
MEVVETSKEISHGAMEAEEPSPTQSRENKLLLVDEQKLVDIEKPHHHDVLCGRGVTTNRHPGNESFRRLVGLNKEMYVTSTKRQKMAISRSIVEAVRSLDPPGRFLDKDPQTALWYDIGHKKAVEKTSQALRDGAATLRKQLSADFGDPDFLNDVFNEDDPVKKEENKKKEGPKTTGKENNKGKSPEKLKPVKAKATTAKKGHRRVRSNPTALSTALSKNHRRVKPLDDPDAAPTSYPPPNYGMFPPSPHSPGMPPPRHARSLPNSPMNWGGGPPPAYSEGPGGYPPYPHHSPYHPSPPTFSPYGKPSNHAHYSRSHSFDYPPRGPPPPPSEPGLSPRHHSWSPYGNHPPPPYPRHQHYHPHHQPPPPPPPGQFPTSPPGGRPPTPPPSSAPNGPLPPGRHKFSPGGYYSHHSKAPEWSPRRVNHHPYNSPRNYSPHRGDYPPSRPAAWTPRPPSPHHHHGYYHHHEEFAEDYEENGDGLSVPSLGVEVKLTSGRYSPTVHLAPRCLATPPRSSETPPRPPNYARRDFNPPVSPNLQRSRSKEERYYQCSPVEEEKKATALQEKDENHAAAAAAGLRPTVTKSSSSNMEAESEKHDSSPCSSVEQQQERESSEEKEDDSGSRASPALLLSVDENGNVEAMRAEDDGSDNDQAVDDIAMSPIPFDREDPDTLMDLPDNLLTLPISPCGPNDDPVMSS